MFWDIFCSFVVKVVVMCGFCVCRFRVWIVCLEVVGSLGSIPLDFGWRLLAVLLPGCWGFAAVCVTC